MSATEARVAELPPCDICAMFGRPPVAAAYDGKTATPQGSWSYMCESCFAIWGAGLGLGRGQRLVMDEEAGQ